LTFKIVGNLCRNLKVIEMYKATNSKCVKEAQRKFPCMTQNRATQVIKKLARKSNS
jgi:hypothetical protein